MKIVFILMLVLSSPTFAESLEEMACGAKLCLSGDGGEACNPYLDKYYSFKVKKYGRTLKWPTKKLRQQFLRKCKNKKGPNE